MTARPWTPDERATLRRMAAAGYSDGEIGRQIGRDRRTVCDVRQRLGIAPGFRPPFRTIVLNYRRSLRFAA